MPDNGPFHATSVMIGGRVLLLSGASGRGKSDLALRLIDRGALLVADDYTDLEAREGILHARAPERIVGRIEMRGVGIIEMPFAREGPVALMLDLGAVPERLPEDRLIVTRLRGVDIPTLPFAAFEASAPIKAEYALRHHGLGGS